MHRHSPGRIQKSKGIKIKHLLRICLLVSVCCWLIFQIKRTPYNKKDLNPSESTKISLKTQNVDEVIKLGRKDLQPKKDIEIHEEEEDDDDEQEEHEIEEDEKSDQEDETVNDEDKDDQDQDAVTQEHEKNQTLYNSGDILEMGISENENKVKNGGKQVNASQDSTIKTAEHGASGNTSTKIQETGSIVNGLPGNPNISSKSTNNSMVVDIQTILNLNESTTKKSSYGSSKRDGESDQGVERDEVQQDGIDSTDFSHLDDMDEDNAAE